MSGNFSIKKEIIIPDHNRRILFNNLRIWLQENKKPEPYSYDRQGNPIFLASDFLPDSCAIKRRLSDVKVTVTSIALDGRELKFQHLIRYTHD